MKPCGKWNPFHSEKCPKPIVSPAPIQRLSMVVILAAAVGRSLSKLMKKNIFNRSLFVVTDEQPLLCFVGRRRGGGGGGARRGLSNHRILPLPHPAVSSLQGKRLPWPLIIEFTFVWSFSFVYFRFSSFVYFGLASFCDKHTQHLRAQPEKRRKCKQTSCRWQLEPPCCFHFPQTVVSTKVQGLNTQYVLQLFFAPHTLLLTDFPGYIGGETVWFCHSACSAFYIWVELWMDTPIRKRTPFLQYRTTKDS